MSKEKDFFDAATYGKRAIFYHLLDQVHPNYRDEDGQTALHILATYGNAPWSRELLKRGANPELQDNYGYTPLAAAVLHMIHEEIVFTDYSEVIALLVQNGDNEKSLSMLYEGCEGDTEESLSAIQSLDMIVKFINLIKEDIDEEVATSIVMNQYSPILAIDSDITSDESEIVDDPASQDLKRSRSDSEDAEPNHKDSKRSHTTTYTDTNEANHHSESMSSDINNEKTNDSQKSTVIEESSLSTPVLEQLLSWIYELPEWLEEQILNSAPIKALIESVEQRDAIYNKQTIVDIFAKSSSIMVGDSVDSAKNNTDTKATIADIYPVESIDMTMVLNEATVAGWILPIVAIGSDNLFGADAGFNGLGGLNVF